MYALPSVAFSALTIITISRNLGPEGRGVLTIFLLSSVVTSSVTSTHCFLNIMKSNSAKELDELESQYSDRSYKTKFFAPGLGIVLFSISTRSFSFSSIFLVFFLNLAYFQLSVKRDLCLRKGMNIVYLIDSIIQGVIFVTIAIITLLTGVSVTLVGIVYLVFVFLQLIIVHKLNRGSKLPIAYFRKIESPRTEPIRHNDLIDGIFQQLYISKDLLIASLVLSQKSLGLMSAAASFWVVFRFLKATTFVHLSVHDIPRDVQSFSARTVINHPLFVQSCAIASGGMLGFYIMPKVMGPGFQLHFFSFALGVISEILLMSNLLALSHSKSNRIILKLVVVMLLQVVFLAFCRFFITDMSIDLIWASSIFTNLVIFGILRFNGFSVRNVV